MINSLFRGKADNRYGRGHIEEKDGNWVYGSLISEGPNDPTPLIISWASMEEKYCGEFSVNPETVGQYTGFKDVNSIIIFDGDILKNLCTEEIGQVAMCEGCWMIISGAREIDFLNNWILDEESEIIGNIWDNPELLKEAKT